MPNSSRDAQIALPSHMLLFLLVRERERTQEQMNEGIPGFQSEVSELQFGQSWNSHNYLCEFQFSASQSMTEAGMFACLWILCSQTSEIGLITGESGPWKYNNG